MTCFAKLESPKLKDAAAAGAIGLSPLHAAACVGAPCQARTALQRCMRRLAAACEAGRQASRACAPTSAQNARRSCSARCAHRAAVM